MEIKLNAAVIRAVDYGENDRILTLLSAEEGKVTASVKGVRKAGAKLRFAAQPFCFCEYVLARTNGRNTVISASEKESFYDIRTDIIKFYAASAACETADVLCMEEYQSGELLSALLRCFAGICEKNEGVELVRFILCALSLYGFAIDAGVCPFCGEDLSQKERLRFDFSSGSFTCAACGEAPKASPSTYRIIRTLGGGGELVGDPTSDELRRALKLISEHVRLKTSSQCKSMTELLRVL
ncbi:MAG: DNA repair protein RecO [Clostridia bacterium]|nr:DNA repair protein RecO [Clostridia bacterium]